MFADSSLVRCAFFDRNLHSRMPLDPTHVHLKPCSLEANMRVTNGIPLGCSLVLPVDTANCVQTLKANGFTRLVELYLQATPTGLAVAFKPRRAVRQFCAGWRSIAARFPGRITVVEVEIPGDTDPLGIGIELIKHCGGAGLPGWAEEYFALGRAAIKLTGHGVRF